MEKFSYYSISGKYKETDIPLKNPQDMVQYLEHFTNGDDEVEDKLLMVYKTTNVKIIEKDDAKKLIEKYL
jgi:hypothetical protein